MGISRRDALVGGGGIITGVSLSTAYFRVTATDTTTATSSDEQSVDVVSENRPVIGDKASVKMFYWNDYQCPFCYRFEVSTLPEINTELIRDGTVQTIIKPINVFGTDSERAALGAHCGYEQADGITEFMTWHSTLYQEYQDNNKENNGWASPQNQASYASNITHINGDGITQCVDNETYSNRVATDMSEADDAGLTGTPFFLFYAPETGDTTTITGSQPFTRYKETINNMQPE